VEEEGRGSSDADDDCKSIWMGVLGALSLRERELFKEGWGDSRELRKKLGVWLGVRVVGVPGVGAIGTVDGVVGQWTGLRAKEGFAVFKNTPVGSTLVAG